MKGTTAIRPESTRSVPSNVCRPPSSFRTSICNAREEHADQRLASRGDGTRTAVRTGRRPRSRRSLSSRSCAGRGSVRKPRRSPSSFRKLLVDFRCEIDFLAVTRRADLVDERLRQPEEGAGRERPAPSSARRGDRGNGRGRALDGSQPDEQRAAARVERLREQAQGRLPALRQQAAPSPPSGPRSFARAGGSPASRVPTERRR